MYLVSLTAKIQWAPDGAGAMTVPETQALEAVVGDAYANAGSFVLVPGLNAPSTSNVNTAVTAAAALASTYLQAQIAQIQGWASGGN
jgi:hypothetical protein